MELQHFNLFNELDVAREDYTLKVRIIRLWRKPMFRNPTETYSIELILLDEEGNRIQASVLNRFFNRFEQFLNEGVCLIITKPQLGSNISKYKYIDNKLKVCLNFSTHVVRCNNFNGHMYGFVMTPYSEILNCIVPDNSSIASYMLSYFYFLLIRLINSLKYHLPIQFFY
ncbi:hypothetical protein QVD17_07303 [Tagetes erecta]|uniref:Replication protein A 70 kDa DNA-binding subunit B/D first OB fold domain-containing protein n=1 Tax=Tagetes erecta TaxID=13708 RepID=A0AAD8P7C0_TARER|nr:hypothetical protein QVD17_07303 [Tagetes erecta]